MKEATGELNMTVVTVVAIAAVGAFFYAIIWPSIKSNLLAQTHCSSAIQCEDAGNGRLRCHYYEDDGSVSNGTIECDNSRNTVQTRTGTPAPAETPAP